MTTDSSALDAAPDATTGASLSDAPLRPSGVPIPVRLDVPEALRAKARYALEELLFGLGLVPVEGHDAPALVYGPEASAVPVGAVHLAFDAHALAADTPGAPLDPARGGWLSVDPPDGGAALSVPLAFGTPEAPDVVATAFVWLAGWAEFGADRDAHGRFPHAASWAHALGLPHDLPVVDALRLHLAAQLRAAGVAVPGRTWGGAQAALALTCDVDALYRVRPGIFKQVFWDDLVRNAKGEPFARRRARADRLLGDTMRPGDPYLFDLAWLADTFAPHGGGTFFVKAGTTSPFDTSVDLGDDALKGLAQMGHEIALHPSYGADDAALRSEDDALRAAFPNASRAVRNHYLRFDPATTPARLAAHGATLDSTLGWAETTGFRRGTTHPFRLYDLAADRPTDVWELPLALMDVALFVRENATAEQGREATARLLAAAHRFGGVLVVLWHNTLSVSDVNPATRAHVSETLAAANALGVRCGPATALLDAWRAG